MRIARRGFGSGDVQNDKRERKCADQFNEIFFHKIIRLNRGARLAKYHPLASAKWDANSNLPTERRTFKLPRPIQKYETHLLSVRSLCDVVFWLDCFDGGARR